MRHNIDTLFRWVPGHSRVPGNEMAHLLAQKAVDDPETVTQRVIQLRNAAVNLAVKAYKQTPTQTELCRHIRQIDKAAPGKHTRKLYDNLKAEDAAILAQLRTGKCRLNQYLADIKIVDSPNCTACGTPETVEHFLLNCKKWQKQRHALAQKAGRYAANVAPLLGGWDDYKDSRGRLLCGPKEKWKPDLNLVYATIAFAKDTGRLSQE